MKNVYDIKYEKCLSFIFPTECCRDVSRTDRTRHEQAAIILYLYYKDTLTEYFKYLDGIPEDIHVYIISSRKCVLDAVKEYSNREHKRNLEFIMKENAGRDVSAFLIAGSEIVKDYRYACFIHDKKRHSPATESETKLWVENLWGNLIGSSSYIDSVLGLLDGNEGLGILSPPDPIGDHFCTWYGFGWHGSYGITKKIAEYLHLETDISMDKPPVTIGTALWFKTEALKKLFAAGWDYKDFNDRELDNSNYLSYGIERIFAYVAQDAGFDTGEVMTTEYARKQNNYLRHSTGRIFAEMMPFFPLPTVTAVEDYKHNLPRLMEFAKRNKGVYLYGAGNMGRFCLSLLRREGLGAEAFIVSGRPQSETLDALPVVSVETIDLSNRPDVGVVVAVAGPEMKMQIIGKLREKRVSNYIEFWKLSE